MSTEKTINECIAQKDLILLKQKLQEKFQIHDFGRIDLETSVRNIVVMYGDEKTLEDLFRLIPSHDNIFTVVKILEFARFCEREDLVSFLDQKLKKIEHEVGVKRSPNLAPTNSLDRTDSPMRSLEPQTYARVMPSSSLDLDDEEITF